MYGWVTRRGQTFRDHVINLVSKKVVKTALITCDLESYSSSRVEECLGRNWKVRDISLLLRTRVAFDVHAK